MSVTSNRSAAPDRTSGPGALDPSAPSARASREAPLILTTEPPRPLRFSDQLAMWANLGISLFGPLTGALIERTGKIAAIEIDRDLAARLRERFPADRLALHEADALAAVARRVMEGAAALAVPLLAETGVGRSWAEAH